MNNNTSMQKGKISCPLGHLLPVRIPLDKDNDIEAFCKSCKIPYSIKNKKGGKPTIRPLSEVRT